MKTDKRRSADDRGAELDCLRVSISRMIEQPRACLIDDVVCGNEPGFWAINCL